MIEESKQTEQTENIIANVAEENNNSAQMSAHLETELNSEVAATDATVDQETSSAGDAAEWEEMEAEISALEQQVAGLKAQLEERTSQYMRIAADFDNFRKRSQKEKEELDQQVKCNTLGALLPVVDNFERAQAQIKPQTDAEKNIHKSYQSIYKQMVTALKSLGVSPMRPKGQEFNPNLHEAAIQEPTNEYPEGTVIDELIPGYFLGDRVLRHAVVKVAAPGEHMVPSEESQPESPES
ncbi:nucleotide exchange factor GrpE [Phormidium sp. LEGE 05292]|uniref:nucleotide exchange factor GrpE n=1 Tax=[Phormidium] sp. LEGE 05292 TaxID=767427 RepID=UPI001881734E|nr:nucleotide exchange factor GrpE [Phormidium sp. LEGE 05292]MBE9227050.1 nucleotide exchange factor GrpE [Phormidium sp. LEGE 05292]